MGKKNKKEIEMQEKGAIVWLPENALEVKVTCKVYMDGKLRKVEKNIDLREAFEEYSVAEDVGYIPPHATFQLTDGGKRILELVDGGMSYEDACEMVDKECK